MIATASNARRAPLLGIIALVVAGYATSGQADAGAESEPLASRDTTAEPKRRLGVLGDDYVVEEIYSCARDRAVVDGRNGCHVSLLLTQTGTGAQRLIDREDLLNYAVSAGAGPDAAFSESLECTCVADDEVLNPAITSGSVSASLMSSY